MIWVTKIALLSPGEEIAEEYAELKFG